MGASHSERRLRRTENRSVPAAAANGVVRVATTMAVPAVLEERGIEPGAVLAEFGLTLSIYDNPENTIPFETSCRILGRCAEATGCAHFGLLVGQRAGISTLGVLGFLMQSSGDVRSALAAAARHFQVHNTAATVEFSEDESSGALGFSILRPGIEGHEQLLDGSMAIAVNILRALCGPQWSAYEVHFARAPPADVAPFKRCFKAPLIFDAGQSAVLFARHWLDRPLPGADPLLHLMMRQRIEDLESRSVEGLVSLLRRILPSLVVTQRASLEVVARRVGLGARTLNRRLAAEGVSFRQLHEEARYGIARQLLEDTRMAANRVADRLGYASASAFTRAFQRWSGMGPADWRASHGRRTRTRSRKV